MAIRQVHAPKSGYLPSLDGWRAIAVLGVLAVHDASFGSVIHKNVGFAGLGGYGVNLFFAISGVLVSTRILQDEQAWGVFRVKDFYLRRLFRIQPAAIFYLAFIAFLNLAHLTHERWSALSGGLFMYQNYLYNANDASTSWLLTGHFWTLAVEEHFYLLLSLFFLLFRKNRAFWMAAILLLLKIAQHWVRAHHMFNEATSLRRTFWQIHFLIFPALLAILLRNQSVRQAALKFLQPWAAFTATLAVYVGLALRHHVHNEAGIWFLLNNDLSPLLYAFGVWVIATMLHPQSFTTRFLELLPLRFLGRLSYSLYLWHVAFFLADVPGITGSGALHFLGSRPMRYVAAFGAALLSYYWVEKPLIRLGHKIAPAATPGHRDLVPTR
jgi:peptidoglycan/LPS O-acetylase OafA/YrhL